MTGERKQMPTIIKVQIVIAVIAVIVTLAAVLQLGPLLQAKQQLLQEKLQLKQAKLQLENDINKLEAKKQEAETSLNTLVAKINKEKSTSVTEAIQPRASASAVTDNVNPSGNQVYDFRLWIDAPNEVKNMISKVSYTFDHSTFRNKVQESADPSSGFKVGYRGWGCLYLVTINVVLKDGRSHPIYFDMCGAL